MRGIMWIVRGNEVKLTLPESSVERKSDGTLWHQGMPILGITDPVVKAAVAADIKVNRYDRIPADAWVRMGSNINGLWAGDDEAWAVHPAKAAIDAAKAAEREQARRQVTIYLSSRGWGDYSPVIWSGDITRPDAEILAACKVALVSAHDVDQPNQSDEEIMRKITAARSTWQDAPAKKAAMEAAERKDIEDKIKSGYCFACGTWCHGDCGHYSNSPKIKFRREFEEAQKEVNYNNIQEGE